MDGRGFRFGDWQVDVGGNSLSHGDARATLEPRAMDVLRYLCRHPGAVIPAEELLQKCWGTAELGDNPVHKAIAQLRRALGDSSTDPRYIETVRKRGYRAIASVVEAADHAETWHGGSPFRGLEAFQESHAAIFFGRVQATQRLRDLVLAQAAGGCPMALVLGPSGSGKTSLVRAGLLPALADAGPVALACVLHMDCADLGGGGLFEALAAVLLDAELDDARRFEGSSADALARRLSEEPAAVAAALMLSGPTRIGLFVDRLEAIFRAPATSDAERARFVAVLEQLARAGVLVILACRNDFYPALIALPQLMALKGRGGHFDVEPPGGADIAQMVRQPARAAQLAFEHDAATGASLDDVLCDAARASPDALPLLQYCLDELYRQRGDDGTLKFDVFRQLGGIEGALGVRAEQVVATLPAAQQAALPHVLSLLVNIGESQSAVTARRPPWSALDNEAKRELVRALVEARLFVSELTGDVPTFGVAHEALLRRWPRVVEWIERHRQALQIRTRVAAQAERWVAAGRPRDLLLPAGMQANQARGLLEIADLALSGQEKDYVNASLRRARLGSRIRFAAMSIILLLAVLAGVLGLTARSAQREAEQRRADAESLMSFMLGDFVDKLRPLGRLDLLDAVSEKALPYLTRSGGGTRAEMAQRAKTLQLIAEVHVARGKDRDALDTLHSARGLLRELDTANGATKEMMKIAGANAYWLGQIHFNRGDWQRAKDFFTAYRDTSKRMVAADRADPDGWLELSYGENSIGSAALRQGRLMEALRHFANSVALKRRVLGLRQEDNVKVDLANALSWQASTEARLGNLHKARSLYKEEQDLLAAAIAHAPGNASWTHRLATARWREGDLLLALGDAAAVERYRHAVMLLEPLTRQDQSNQTWALALMTVQLKALVAGALPPARLLADLGHLRTRLFAWQAGRPPSREGLRLQGKMDDALARTHLAVGDTAAAAAALAPALELYERLRASGTDAALDSGHAQALLLQSTIARARGDATWRAGCARARDLTTGPSQQSDYAVMAAGVHAALCLGAADSAAPLIAALHRMGYRDTNYVITISQYHQQEGNHESKR